MAIHWQIPFKTLRKKEVLTVNVYDDAFTGTPLVLKAAGQPFETEEDNDDDPFSPVRLQSGYLRIVDDGYCADGVTPFDWRAFIPTTDTDRFVTLTDASDNIRWMGYLQAQNFGAALFGNPQEREFPVQCCLSVLQGVDFPASVQAYMPNFAYVLTLILAECYPVSSRPASIVIQGDAPTILTRVVDWANFADWDDETRVVSSSYKHFEVLESFCKFWGLTARTYKDSVYFLCADDTDVQQLYTITPTQLANIAAGNEVTLVPSTFVDVEITGGFASTDNKDYQMRGASKAVYEPEPNEDETIIELFDNPLEVEMEEGDWDPNVYYYNDGDRYNGRYKKTVNLYHIENDKCSADGDSFTHGGSFNLVRKGIPIDQGAGYEDPQPVLMIHNSYALAAVPSIAIRTLKPHAFSQGFFRILGDTYIGGEKYYYDSSWYAGDKDTYMRFGVGMSINDALWWDGEKWVNDDTAKFRATLGNKKPEMFSTYIDGGGVHSYTSILLTSTMYGYVFVQILGSDNFPETDNERAFNIKDFKVEFQKNVTVVKEQSPNYGWWKIKEKNLKEVVYKSENGNAIYEEESYDSIFCSDNRFKPGYGVVLNPDGTYFEGMIYSSAMEHPEQHLCNRVTNYWASSKRKVEAEVLTHDGSAATVADGVTPGHMVTVDGTKLHPHAISRKWRDDVVSMMMMEVGSLYDAEVEWLQSDGTAYIDTGFKHDNNTRIVCKLEHVGTVQTYSYPFGSLGGASGSNKLFTACINGSSKLATYYGTGTAHAFNISGSGVHTFDLNKRSHKVDNTTYSFSTRTFSSSYNTLIFGMTGYDGAFTASKTTVRFYYFQIYDDGTLVRDFVPVRKNGVGYLYDKVSGQLYGNANSSGAFTYGNDVTT